VVLLETSVLVKLQKKRPAGPQRDAKDASLYLLLGKLPEIKKS